eukprot:4041707-Amphidinium_carterae.1
MTLSHIDAKEQWTLDQPMSHAQSLPVAGWISVHHPFMKRTQSKCVVVTSRHSPLQPPQCFQSHSFIPACSHLSTSTMWPNLFQQK